MKHFLGEEADDEDGDEDEESDEDIEWEAVRATTVIQAEKGSKSDAEGVVNGASKVKDKKKKDPLDSLMAIIGAESFKGFEMVD